MKNKAAKRAIVSYYVLSLLLTLPLLIPIWLIHESLGVIAYLVCFLIYMRIAINFAVRVTVMRSLWQELDAEKYASIINAKPFRVHYSYKLILYLAVGDYQSAYNVISSALLKNKNVQNRIYGHVLLCRVCFERGDYEGIKDQLAELEQYFRYNSDSKIPKHSKEEYEFYCAFSKADYTSACAILERSIEKYSKKKNKAYFLLIRRYRLAVTKRMMGDVEEAVALFEQIRENAPKLFLSTLAQQQLAYISGTLEEALPGQIEVTEAYSLKSYNKAQRVFKLIGLITISVGLILIVVSKIMIQLDSPEQENKDPAYMEKIESTLYDDYDDREEYRILGYLSVYTDDSCAVLADSIFLVESDNGVDLHSLYLLSGKDGNHLNVRDIQVDQIYAYENIFSKKVEFVLTEKKRDIPENALYYYEIDGYYFCLISAS